MELLQRPARLHELNGEPVEQFGMARPFALQAEVLAGAHDAGAEDELPEDQQEYLKLNAELAEVWPNLTEKKEASPEAEQWADKPNKLQYLER